MGAGSCGTARSTAGAAEGTSAGALSRGAVTLSCSSLPMPAPQATDRALVMMRQPGPRTPVGAGNRSVRTRGRDRPNRANPKQTKRPPVTRRSYRLDAGSAALLRPAAAGLENERDACERRQRDEEPVTLRSKQ